MKIHEVEIVLVRDALAGYVIAGGVRYCETETSVLRKLQDAFSRTRIVLGTDSFRPTHSNVEPTVGDAGQMVRTRSKARSTFALAIDSVFQFSIVR